MALSDVPHKSSPDRVTAPPGDLELTIFPRLSPLAFRLLCVPVALSRFDAATPIYALQLNFPKPCMQGFRKVRQSPCFVR